MSLRSLIPLCLFGWSCASAPFPGDERYDRGESFEAVPQEAPASDGAAHGGPSSARTAPTKRGRENDLAAKYRPPPSVGPKAEDILQRHYAKCRPPRAPTNVVVAGRAKLNIAGEERLGPYELVIEPDGRFLERMTLAASADDLDYGEGVESERGFDGKVAWRRDGRAGAYFVDEIEQAIFAVDARLFLGQWAGTLKDLETMGSFDLDGLPALRVRGQSQGGELFDLYFHRDTSFLLGRAHLNPESPDEALSEMKFFELSARAGLCLPKRIEVVSSGEKRVMTLLAPHTNVQRKPIAPPPELRDIGGLEGE